MTLGTGDLIFIGDVHLEQGDAAAPDFLRFLGSLRETASRVVLLGDLFNLWVGMRGLEGELHRQTLGVLEILRRSGVRVSYLEGNRDFGVTAAGGARALDEVSDIGFDLTHGGKRIYASHGDLVNPSDRQYRAWRRVARSSAAWWLLRSIPEVRRTRLAGSLEARLRSTNLAYKGHFPEEAVRAYGEAKFAIGFDAVVLGHFHVERDLCAGTSGHIFVVPEWKGTRRHLRVSAGGEIGFEGSGS